MKAALVIDAGFVANVIVWDDSCIAPDGTVAHVVEDDVMVAPGWTYADGTFIAPPEPKPLESE
jgi:hypothetical protein